MGLFANFVDRAWAAKLDRIGARADRAGKAAKAKAQELARVDTGNMRSLVGYYWDRSTLTLTLYDEAPYAFWVERRYPFMRPARELMRQLFIGGTSDIQFSTLPEHYHGRAREITGGAKGTIIGRRVRRRGHP